MTEKKNFTTLLNDKVKEIARTARNSPERRDMPWFRRGEVMGLLAQALTHKADTVFLDGQKFDVVYRDKRAIIRPSDGTFVPTANIHVETYLGEFEAFQNQHKVTRLET